MPKRENGSEADDHVSKKPHITKNNNKRDLRRIIVEFRKRQCPVAYTDSLAESGISPIDYYLFKAAGAGYTDLVHMLLNMGANPTTLCPVNSSTKRNALQTAALKKRYACVHEIESRFPEIIDKTYGTDLTPIYIAASVGDLSIVKLLREFDAEITFARKNGSTLLFTAAKHGHSHVVSWLLFNGLAADVIVKSESALVKAIQCNDVLSIQKLFSAGAIINDERVVKPPLHYAAELGYTHIVELLLDYGAEVDIQDEMNGFTALMLAAANGHQDAVLTLIEHGADVDLARNDGSVALHAAIGQGHDDTVQLLLHKNADPNTTNLLGMTPLDYANARKEAYCAQLLLEASADPNVKSSGKPPVKYVSLFSRGRKKSRLFDSDGEADKDDKAEKEPTFKVPLPLPRCAAPE